MIDQFIDLSALPEAGIMGGAAFWAYRTVSKATKAAYITQVAAADARVAQHERLVEELRAENLRLRTLLQTSEQADKGDN